jgi:transglutaminase-like putative cysteine protease
MLLGQHSIGGEASNDFAVFRIGGHIWLIACFYIAALLSSWFFWTSRFATSLEALIASSVFLWLLSGHRNYHLDAPKDIIRYAWSNPFGVFEPQHFLLGLGVIFTLIVAIYLWLANNRPLFGSQIPHPSVGRVHKVSAFCSAFFVLGLFLLFASYVNRNYSSDLSRASNGVGTGEQEEGESPLGFHSAVGKTRQPSALVRLEGDYPKNPWTPMFYMREGALSRFGGKELVIASQAFDQDVPRVKVGEPYVGLRTKESEFRSELIQSIYLLTQHSAPFAVDYPSVLRLIKNPDEERFSFAYQAISQAPTIDLRSMIGEEVGSKDWDKKTWAHYLRAPGSRDEQKPEELPASYSSEVPVQDKFGEDLRYKMFARNILSSSSTPIEKAMAIVAHLSEHSLYTRKPGHTLTEGGDPVAPYLFSEEMRGYCVHFAHAAVYLMRLVGIPSRIATGYLTDLTYAKDGHVLLHLGDRHAWPEVYVRGIGWVVVDITPANAENEEPIVPDENLLEELMGKIDPAEELISPPPLAPEDMVTEPILSHVVNRTTLFSILIIGSLVFIVIKSWYRFSWRLARNPRRRIQCAYLAMISLLVDIGATRRHGETRLEFANRIYKTMGINVVPVTQLNEKRVYDPGAKQVSQDQLKQLNNSFKQSFDGSRSRLQRYLAFFSPISVSQRKRL